MTIMSASGYGPIRELKRKGKTFVLSVQPPIWLGQYPKQQIVMNASQARRYVAWEAGKGLIQNVLPDLTTSEREIILNGGVDVPQPSEM